MRRFQMLIEPELYEALARRAAEEGGDASVAGLLRRFARERLDSEAQANDPFLDERYEGPTRHDDESLGSMVYERPAR